MKFYLFEKPEWFTGDMDILDFHKSINMQDFMNDRMHRIPAMLFMQIKHREYVEYPGILLEPIPLFEEKLWQSILQFMEKPIHTHFLLMDEKTRHTRNYYCPDFRRIKGSVKITGEPGERQTAQLVLEEERVKDIPAFYLQDGRRLWMMFRLDLVESFMRQGLCDIKLIPIEGEEMKWNT